MTDHEAQSHVKVSFETLGMVVAVGLPLVFNRTEDKGCPSTRGGFTSRLVSMTCWRRSSRCFCLGCLGSSAVPPVPGDTCDSGRRMSQPMPGTQAKSRAPKN